jgi:hypothetical protein
MMFQLKRTKRKGNTMPSEKLSIWLILIPIIGILLWQCPDNPVKPDNNPDTTSHNFTWEIFTFGDHASSSLSDVAIIDENNIWAVGEIYLNDSLGQRDVYRYNAVHWDGEKWEVKRITAEFRGSLISPPLGGIITFSASDIWAVSSLPIHGDGNNWEVFDLRTTVDPNLSLSKVWGSSPNDIYFVGRAGSIAHYDGNNWRKIETGTTLSIYDIYGAYNSQKQDWEILAIASNIFNNEGCELFRIDGEKVNTLDKNGLAWGILGIWFVTNQKYYIVGDGIHYKDQLSDPQWVYAPSLTSYASGGISGNGLNDIFVVGSFMEIVHYNGSTWHNYFDDIPFSNGGLGEVAVKDDLIAICGYRDREAIVIIGRR